MPTLSSQVKRWLRILAVPAWISLGVAALWFALNQVDSTQLWASLTGAALTPLLLGLVVDVMSVFCKATKWHLLLRPMGKVPQFKLQGAIYAGGAVSMVLPFRLDEAVRAYVASRFSGLPTMTVLGSMALERLVDICVLLGFLLTLTFLLPLPPVVSNSILVISAVGGALVMILVAVHLFSSRDWLKGVVARLLDSFAQGSRALMKPHLVAGAMVFSACEWLLTGTVAGLVSHSAGIDLPFGGLVLTTTLLFGSFALAVVPAGIGVFQVACELALPPLYGITKVQAVTLALLIHTLLLFPMATVGTTVIVATGVKLKDLKQEEEE